MAINTIFKQMKLTMRVAHRYVGFFLIGIMSVYAISGVVLTFRGTNIFKQGESIEKQVDADLSSNELGRVLRMRHFNVDSIAGDIMYFEDGQYNVSTGDVSYISYSYPDFVTKMIKLHMTSSRNTMAWLTTIFGVALLFLAVSSFWMFKPKTKNFKKGLIVAIAGIVFTIIILYL